MKKLAALLVALLSLSSTSFTQIQKQKFEIKGNVSGFADSTMLYLDELATSSPTRIDSTFISKGQFYFTGSLKSDVEQMIITTDRFTDYKKFWLENSRISFNGEKGKFRDAVVTGSKTQDEENELALKIKTSGNEKAEDVKFIRSHPNSIVSLNTLNVYATSWGKDTASILYNTLSEKMKNTESGKNIIEFITVNKSANIGDTCSDFTEPDVEGKNVSVSDFHGKLLLLEFWGSWCGPCREGNPELVKIYNEFKSSGFNILGVAADENKKQWTDAVKQDSLPWQNVCDLHGDKNRAVLMYGISYYPMNFLIDKNGVIIAKDLRGDALRNKLRELLH